MKKQNPNIYEFPLEMQREFHLLINSKESFLKNLTVVEQVKLETLYEQLKDAWTANLTQKLNKDLETKYSELREIQTEIEKGSEEFTMIYKGKLIDNLNLKAKELEKRAIKLSESIITEEKKLKEDTQIWKKDIIERNSKLSAKKTELENYKKDLSLRTSQRLIELRATLKNWESAEKVLMKELEKLEVKKSSLNNHVEIKRGFLKSQQLKLKENSEKLKKEELVYQENLEIKRNSLEQNLQQEQKELEANLKLIAEQQLKKLRTEISMEFPTLPNELRKLWTEGNFSQLSSRLSMIQKENEQLNNFLTKNLGRIGIGVELFMKKVDEVIR